MGSAFPFFRLRDLPLPGRSIFFRSILNKSIPKNTPHSTHNPKMTEISPLQKERAAYQPKLPTLLAKLGPSAAIKEGKPTESVADQAKIRKLFPDTYGLPAIEFKNAKSTRAVKPVKVGVILSGGQGPGEAITEAECMRRALVRRGVDESRLYPEERSTSTQENLRYSRAILEELGVDPARRVAIVTSDFHLCRARLMWGGDTAAVPAHLPSALYFQCLTVNYFIREAFGLAAYFVYGG